MSDKKPSRGYLSTVLSCRCPRCREGKLFQFRTSINFKRNMAMHKNCPVCSQPTEIEVGFYYGTAFVSYGLTVALSVASFVVWVLTIGISVNDNRLFWWLGFNAVFYANVISGSHMPNLMYMTSFDNMQSHDEHWKAFGNDPEWKKLSALQEYQHNVSHIDIILMKAATYSDL